MNEFTMFRAMTGLALAAALPLAACANGTNGTNTGTEAHRLVAEGALLLDVRTPQEFADGHLEGAINVPVQVLERRLDDVGPKDRPLVVYCRSGGRSATATSVLRSAGFTSVHDLGPMGAW